MKIFYLSSEEVPSLCDVQVWFHLDGGLVKVDQVNIDCEFTGIDEVLDHTKLGESAIAKIEKICADWYNANSCKFKEYNNDDKEIA